jgi:hypothetical protein
MKVERGLPDSWDGIRMPLQVAGRAGINSHLDHKDALSIAAPCPILLSVGQGQRSKSAKRTKLVGFKPILKWHNADPPAFPCSLTLPAFLPSCSVTVCVQVASL